MKFKKSFLIFCLLICFFSIANVAASDVNETIWVNENQDEDVLTFNSNELEALSMDEETKLEASQGSFEDLFNDIENSDGELNLTKNYIYKSSDSKRIIQINKTISINGNGFTIDGNNKGSGFFIVADNVSLNNISFINCMRNNYGSAIYWENENGTLSNCNFENCYVNSSDDFFPTYAGAVYWLSNNGIIENCNFVDCFANSIKDCYGGALCGIECNTTVINCSFVNCHVSVSKKSYIAYGGAFACLNWWDDNGDWKLIDCVFQDNYVPHKGGAIYSRCHNLEINNCIFKDNAVTKGNGGAILFETSIWDDDYDNTCLGCSIAEVTDCLFDSNHANNGGAIYESHNGTMITNCRFINNTANYNGGALYVNCKSEYVSDCTFLENKANNGGAIFWQESDGVFTSSIILNNSAKNDAGIYIGNNNINIKDSVLFSSSGNPAVYTDSYIVIANYNWWGNTFRNYDQKPILPSRVLVKNWLFLNFTVYNTSLKVDENAIINCDITNLITQNGVISRYDAFNLPIINFSYETNDNIINSTCLICGIGTVNYTACNIPNSTVIIKYYGIKETFFFKIEKGNVRLNISEPTMFKGNLSVSSSSNVNGIVHVKINNKVYSTNMSRGKSYLPIIDLPMGRYLATFSLDSDLYNMEEFSSYITIKSSIDANDLTINSYNNKLFRATFYDFEGNVLKNTKVTFLLNDELKTAITDDEGIASFNINLNSGIYEITSLNPVTDETKINTITINPQPIDEKDMNVPALPNSVGGSVTVKLPSDATGTVTLSIGGKDYKFDVVNGVANVKVPDLANGAYSYSITYSGDGKYSSFTKTGKLTVNKPAPKPVTKTTLTLKKVKVKRSAKKLYITATLKINGKAVKGKVIKFKFNKKSYKAKTNAKGVAKIKVTKKVLKKLKAGKKVKYQATYGKITKKVTVKVKK